jgi:hypothetical protein
LFFYSPFSENGNFNAHLLQAMTLSSYFHEIQQIFF